MGFNMYRALERLGVELVPYEGIDGMVSPLNVWGSPPMHVRESWEGQNNVCLTMWETLTIPAAFRSPVDAFERLIVPSEQNNEMFGRYHPDVRYVPLGIESEVWKPTPRVRKTPFEFLTLANSPRKGNDLMAKAFREVFGTDEKMARLVILDKSEQTPTGDGVLNIRGPVPEAELVAMYANANCYLGASRGEGFGFQPLQAIAQACPTILTNAHGHAQFAHLGIPISAGFSQSWGFAIGDAGLWWEPDYYELCKAMWDVYENYDRQCERAWVNAQNCAAEFSWDRSARLLVEAVEDLSGDMIEKGPPKRLPQRYYLTRVTTRVQCMIAGVYKDFWPDVDYYEPADVKRVIYDAGKLDPEVTLLADPGMTREQTLEAGYNPGKLPVGA